MANPSPGNSITLRVEAPSSFSATSELAAAVGAAGRTGVPTWAVIEHDREVGARGAHLSEQVEHTQGAAAQVEESIFGLFQDIPVLCGFTVRTRAGRVERSDFGLFAAPAEDDEKDDGLCAARLFGRNEICEERCERGLRFWKELLAAEPCEQTEPAEVASEVRSNVSREQFIRAVERAQDYIQHGHIYQVNLSHRLSVLWHGTGWDFFLKLKDASPAPYAACRGEGWASHSRPFSMPCQ